MIEFSDLRCDGAIDPLAITHFPPELSWRIDAGKDDAKITALRLVAAGTGEELAAGKFRIDTALPADARRFEWTLPLHARERAVWRIGASAEGGKTVWSHVACFETGLADNSDWCGVWVD